MGSHVLRAGPSPPGTAPPPAGASFGWWVGGVHALLALSWTAYVLFLPSFLARVGLPATIVVWVVLIDQALFTVTDWGSAVLADRVARVWRRLGAAIAAAALLCALLFAAMPWAAGAGSSTLLLVVIACWAAISSFLRAPVLALLGHVGSATRRGHAVGLALGLVGVAGAFSPLFTGWLRAHDPHWPFALAAGALALGGLVALRADAWPVSARVPLSEGARGTPLLGMVALLWLAGLGFQWHTILLANAAPLPWARAAWAPLFWGGFALGLLLSAGAAGAGAQPPALGRGGAGGRGGRRPGGAAGDAAGRLRAGATAGRRRVGRHLAHGAFAGARAQRDAAAGDARRPDVLGAGPGRLVPRGRGGGAGAGRADLERAASAAWLAAAAGFWWHPWRATAAAPAR